MFVIAWLAIVVQVHFIHLTCSQVSVGALTAFVAWVIIWACFATYRHGETRRQAALILAKLRADDAGGYETITPTADGPSG